MREIGNPQQNGNGNVSAPIDLSLVPESKPAEGGLITSWQLLEKLIPRGFASVVAGEMRVAVKYVNAWCRESLGDMVSGMRNPIDRVCRLIAAVHRFNPLGSAFIVEFIVNFHRQLSKKEAVRGFANSEARRDETTELLNAATKAVNSLNTVGATDESLFALVELRETCNRLIEPVQIEIVDRARQSRAGQNRLR